MPQVQTRDRVLENPMPLPSNLTQLDGSALPAEITENTVILFVNVASKCGLTPQYEGLADLHTGLQNRGFALIGVPCNQFGGQEPGSAEEITQFCSATYGVDFPLLEKQEVNGAGRSALYQHLIGDGPDITWNFEKILVSRKGEVLARFEPKVTPEDSQLRTAILDAVDD
jgi:glutathione peroxidase-family protein